MPDRPLHLNVGSGTHPWGDPWINIDIISEPGFADRVDVVADVMDLPFDDQSASMIYAGHLLEHLKEVDVPKALAEIKRVLMDDGVLMVVGPDLDRATKIAPNMVPAIWPGAATDGPGGHKWPSTESKTVEFLIAAAFDAVLLPVAAVPEEWPCPNRVGWQFAIRCTKTKTM